MPPNGISSSDYARVCLYGLLSTHRLHLTLFPFSEPSLRPCRVASPIRASTRIQNFSTGLSFPCRSGPSLSRGPLPACTVRNFGPPGARSKLRSSSSGIFGLSPEAHYPENLCGKACKGPVLRSLAIIRPEQTAPPPVRSSRSCVRSSTKPSRS